MKFNLSKSLIGAYADYNDGKECGLRFESIYINKTLSPEPSEAMLLGRYFEYLCTGYYDGDVAPEPKTKRDGSLTAEYMRAEIQADNFKNYVREMGIEILQVGKKIVSDGCSMILDILAMYQGREVIIDLKYTARLRDKWDDNGWEAFEYKTKHHTQAIHYSFMTGLPFYYFVFSSTNEDVEFFEVVMEQPITNEIHEAKLRTIRANIELETKYGFQARPTVMRCASCELKQTCKQAAKYPEPKTQYIQTTLQ